MKKIAVMQPTYLPWYGYFGLIDYVDEFVFLNDVQFEKRSWQSRNYIKSHDEKLMLSVGVSTKGKFYQNLDQVLIIDEVKNKKKHLRAIELNYKKTRYFNDFYPLLLSLYNQKHEYLIQLNVEIIKLICKTINITTNTSFSNSIKINCESKVEKIVKICQYFDANIYISPEGSKNYLSDTNEFELQKIKLNFFKIKDFAYHQIGKEFISHLSIIDLIFNEGPNTLNIIRKNFSVL